MSWTRESKLDALMRLPWTIDAERNTELGYVVLRAREVMGSLATGSEDEVTPEFWESLRAALACYLDAGDETQIPLPAQTKKLPWQANLLARKTIMRSSASREQTAGSAAVLIGAPR